MSMPILRFYQIDNYSFALEENDEMLSSRHQSYVHIYLSLITPSTIASVNGDDRKAA